MPGVEFAVSRSAARAVGDGFGKQGVGAIVKLPDFGFDDDAEFEIVMSGEFSVVVRSL